MQSVNNAENTGKSRGYNFMVVLGQVKFPCSKVSGIVSVKDTETLAEGGVNDRVYTLAASPKTENTLILERGVGLDISSDYCLQPGYRFASDIQVFVQDIHHTSRYVYTFSGGYVKSVKFTDMDALRSELIIEHMEISYETMVKEAV